MLRLRVPRLHALRGWLMLAALMTAALPAHAARLYVIDPHVRNDPTGLWFEPRCNAVLTGTIWAGDFEKIRQQLLALARQLQIAGAPSAEGEGSSDRIQWDVQDGFLALCLSSSGGDIREAIKIGTLFNGWMKVVGEGEECASACAILFMMGGERLGVFGVNRALAGRYLHVRGRLGFHAPALEAQTADGRVDPALQQQAYARSLGTIALLGFLHNTEIEENIDRLSLVSPMWGADRQFADSREYLFIHQGIIPIGLLGAILSTPPDLLYRIETVNQALAWGIDLYGYRRPRVLSKAMLYVGCINVQGHRCEGNSRCLMLNRRKRYDWAADYMRGDYDPAGYDPEVFLRQSDRLLAPRKEKPWPRSRQQTQGLTSQAVAMADVCEVRATWRGAQVVDLEIDSFNSNRRSGRPLLQDPGLNEAEGRRASPATITNHLRPWKMLPARTRLEELDKDPWKWLEAGGDYLDKPAGFAKPKP